MAIIKTAARKVAEKTVKIKVTDNKVVTNLTDRKANRISKLSKNNPVAETVKEVIEGIKDAAINGEYIYKTEQLSPILLKLLIKTLKDKKYATVKYRCKGGKYVLISYWGPNTQLIKVAKITKKDLGDVDDTNGLKADNLEYQALPKTTWLKTLVNKKVAYSDKADKDTVYEKA